jgi:hypothetical protein
MTSRTFRFGSDSEDPSMSAARPLHPAQRTSAEASLNVGVVSLADMPLLLDGIAGNLPLPVRTCVFRDRRKRRSAGHGSPLLLGFPLYHPAAYPIGDR